ncbi:hypothetical protein BDK51DRAFT_29193, partial [Blyttiomyces helicus]
ILKKSPDNLDAVYVHFFHEKIPSRMLAANTTPEPLDRLIAAYPAVPEYYRTRAMVRVFREEYAMALKDFKIAISLTRKRRRLQSAGKECGGGPDGTHASVGGAAAEEHDIGSESQLYFLRAACFHQYAVSLIEKDVMEDSAVTGLAKVTPGLREAAVAAEAAAAETEAGADKKGKKRKKKNKKKKKKKKSGEEADANGSGQEVGDEEGGEEREDDEPADGPAEEQSVSELNVPAIDAARSKTPAPVKQLSSPRSETRATTPTGDGAPTAPASSTSSDAARTRDRRALIAQLARRSIRDYTHFLSFFPCSLSDMDESATTSTWPPSSFSSSASVSPDPSTPSSSPPSSPSLSPTRDFSQNQIATLPDFVKSLPVHHSVNGGHTHQCSHSHPHSHHGHNQGSRPSTPGSSPSPPPPLPAIPTYHRPTPLTRIATSSKALAPCIVNTLVAISSIR